ncbi:MAG: response regulator [Lachnospiraceae bacterium]|nr:response regulator [Lachnospiraceae bacterium]
MRTRILVIDDDPLNLKMAKYILKDGYEVICAESGPDGLRILRDKEVDLVLLDLDMPQMNGMQVLQRIREKRELADLKVVILTASGERENVMEAIRLGARDFIKKPFFPTELLERIKAVLQTEGKETILVVDDDNMSITLVKKMLGLRYELVCVSSGRDALFYLRDNVPDLVLLDLHMPEMDGFQVMEKMRIMEKVCDVPVLVLTADNDRETEVKIFKAGAMDYITKPYAPEVVIRRISRVIEWHHCRMSLQQEVDKKTAELRESNRKVTNLSTQVMLALTSAIDAKDKYTKGHSARVANYSRELARRMGKSAQEMNDIYFIALMHDIGKIGIPDSIINKPSRLTYAEYDLMKTHCTIGAEILGNISEIPDISVGARSHHERYDGDGYPDGLKGEDIPEVARIICVADAYDAMTSKNRYRDVMPRAEVESEIRKGRGSQFDPAIADHLLAMIREDAVIREQE